MSSILLITSIFCLLLVMALLMESFIRNFNARFVNPNNSLWRTSLHITLGFMGIVIIVFGFAGLIIGLESALGYQVNSCKNDSVLVIEYDGDISLVETSPNIKLRVQGSIQIQDDGNVGGDYQPNKKLEVDGTTVDFETILCPFCWSVDYTELCSGQTLSYIKPKRWIYYAHLCNSCNKLFVVEEHEHPTTYTTKPYKRN